jgi:hypothetical protein
MCLATANMPVARRTYSAQVRTNLMRLVAKQKWRNQCRTLAVRMMRIVRARDTQNQSTLPWRYARASSVHRSDTDRQPSTIKLAVNAGRSEARTARNIGIRHTQVPEV